MGDRFIKHYAKRTIRHDPELGYFTEGFGRSNLFGYCDTLAEIEAEIDRHDEEERQHYDAIEGRRDDTPCLPEPWWHQR